MSVFAETVHTVASHMFAAVPIDVPNPGQGELPPGVSGKVLMLLRWAAGFGVTACVGGFIYVGTKMALAHQRGDNADLGRLGKVAAACVVVGSASAITAVLTI